MEEMILQGLKEQRGVKGAEMILQGPKQQRAEQAQCGLAAEHCQGGDKRHGKAEGFGPFFAFVKIRLQSQTPESRGMSGARTNPQAQTSDENWS